MFYCIAVSLREHHEYECWITSSYYDKETDPRNGQREHISAPRRHTFYRHPPHSQFTASLKNTRLPISHITSPLFTLPSPIMVALTSLLTLAPMALALPTLPSLINRAGGPIAKPIPADCTLTSIQPSSAATSFSLDPTFQTANQVYSYFLEDDSTSANWNETAKLQQCLEQCFGIGTGCTSVLWAHDIPHVSYGVQSIGVGCLFMHVEIEEGDLVAVDDGTYTSAQAIDVNCPA